MPKLKKTRKAQKFQYNKSRKRLRDKVNSTGTIKNPVIKQAWEKSKTVIQNIKDMGLSMDANKALKIPSTKTQRIKFAKIVNGFVEEDDDEAPLLENESNKKYVAEMLEKDAKEFRPSKLRLPKSQVKLLTTYLDKYGFDYKAMSLDKKNFNQETWKQLRAKVHKFMGIEEQWSQYINAKKKEGDEIEIGKGKWIENNSDDEL